MAALNKNGLTAAQQQAANVAAANARKAANVAAANQRMAANQAKSAGNAATAPASTGSQNTITSQSLAPPPAYQPALDALATAQGTLAQKQAIATQSPTAANLAAVKALQNRVKTDASTVAQRKSTASLVNSPAATPTNYGTTTTVATGSAASSPVATSPASGAADTYYMGNTPTATGAGGTTGASGGQSIYSIDPNTGQTYAADAAALASGTSTTTPTTATSTSTSLLSSPYVKYALIAGLIGGGAWLYLRTKKKEERHGNTMKSFGGLAVLGLAVYGGWSLTKKYVLHKA